MRRPSLAACAMLVVVGSCSGGADRVTPPSMARSSLAHPSPRPSPSALASQRLVLTADLAEAPSKWRKVFFVPFGRRSTELGFKVFRESVNSQPSSFAIDADGSVWIADRWKDRLAHYSPAGRFLGAVRVARPPPDVTVGGQRGRIRDVVQAGGGLYVLLEPSGGPVAQVDHDGRVEFFRPRLEGRNLWVAEIFPSEERLTILVGGFVNGESGFVEEGPIGFFGWQPPGTPERLQGVPGARGSSILLQRIPGETGSDQDFELRFTAPGGTFVLPFRVEVRTGRWPGGRILPGEVGPGNLVSVDDDVLMYVMLSPSRARDARQYGGGRWLLRLGRSPVLWERLPDPGIPDEPQTRHLAVGPGGSIYLMVAEKGGMLILRRP